MSPSPMSETDSLESTWANRSLPPKAKASSSLKRSYAASRSVPPLPKITGDLMLEVFTHRSLRFEGAPSNEDYGDNARIALLGSQAMQMVITWCLFCKRPMLTADDIVTERKQWLSDANVDSWLTDYELRGKLRFTAEAMATLNTPDEARLLFNSYVGAVYIQHGIGAVHDWIAKLIDPDSPTPDLPNAEAKRMKTAEHTYVSPPPPPLSSTPGSPMAAFPPTPAASATPAPMPSFGIPPPPPTAAPTATYLPIFNQTATQRRISVDYPAVFSGPQHAGRWTVKCMVNGAQRGEGTAASKQTAKEDAAKQAYFALGWGGRQGSSQPSMSGGDYISPPPSGTSGIPIPIKTEDYDMTGPSGHPSQHSQSYQSGSSLYPQPHYQPANQPYHPPNQPYQPPPPPPAVPPPPLPAPLSYPPPPLSYPPPPSNPFASPPPAPAQSGPAYLPIFNQTATQRRLNVDYPAEFSGPPHAGRWIVKCVVNGVVKGQGQGPSKQLAKEEAAKQAFHAMGWRT